MNDSLLIASLKKNKNKNQSWKLNMSSPEKIQSIPDMEMGTHLSLCIP